MTDRNACIIFNMISGIGYSKFQALCDTFESPSNALKQSAESLQRVRGIGPQLSERIANYERDVDLDNELRFVERAGVRILTLYDEAYPAVLRELYDPPLVLYVRGVLPEFGQNVLAVVGSRRMSRYGQEMTATLTTDAVSLGFVIVSGLAYGVDTVAHRATVDAGGVTVAVLGGGLARLHPQENIPLARRIIETGGAIISEFPMTFPVSRTSFPRRNRIVARLSNGVLVTEAGISSGAMITANLGLEYGVTVMAVPGRVDNPQSKGCHKLIRDGAALIENITDITEAMECGLLPNFSFNTEMREPHAEYVVNSVGDLSEEERLILDILYRGEISFDDLAAETGYDTGRLTAATMKLEMVMLIQHSSDQIYSLR